MSDDAKKHLLEYLQEAREALVAWGAHVQRLINGETFGAEVVPLRRA